jgi:hypothetical protein
VKVLFTRARQHRTPTAASHPAAPIHHPNAARWFHHNTTAHCSQHQVNTQTPIRNVKPSKTPCSCAAYQPPVPTPPATLRPVKTNTNLRVESTIYIVASNNSGPHKLSLPTTPCAPNHTSSAQPTEQRQQYQPTTTAAEAAPSNLAAQGPNSSCSSQPSHQTLQTHDTAGLPSTVVMHGNNVHNTAAALYHSLTSAITTQHHGHTTATAAAAPQSTSSAPRIFGATPAATSLLAPHHATAEAAAEASTQSTNSVSRILLRSVSSR